MVDCYPASVADTSYSSHWKDPLLTPSNKRAVSGARS